MAVNVRRLSCEPEAVFRVLADGWLFASWVVGASRLRDVDADWPRAGTQLEHSFGVWPVLIDDETTSLEWDPPRRAVLQPQGWPLGEARVEIEVRPHPGGCLVRMREIPAEGPGRFIRAVLEPYLLIRNHETLRRLAFLAEGGAGRR
ncbi:SRPBCC family protein [Homoserinibacter sp. YIM 151385]|uniref:SRPBCC family protein n=1 Tax=Homoserinibacter sp. YIM 151385 TaxID=2985506 RepID=UPI0022F06553|nr:SRPBCC family protein [Homoserinibacter sp. YIM 151385]WBU39073.1 SRPBCC family protein [Homoserinibacter sp. YIM 151385]